MPSSPTQSATLTPLLGCKQQVEEGRGCRILATACGGGRGDQLKVQLMIQRIPDVRGEMCSVLWDTGAQISLVTHQYAREAGFKGRPASIRISGVGTGKQEQVQSAVQGPVEEAGWEPG
jgi:hypothetical protein